MRLIEWEVAEDDYQEQLNLLPFTKNGRVAFFGKCQFIQRFPCASSG